MFFNIIFKNLNFIVFVLLIFFFHLQFQYFPGYFHITLPCDFIIKFDVLQRKKIYIFLSLALFCVLVCVIYLLLFKQEIVK